MKDKGFTLVELMGVIIILGIILLIATPSINKILKGSKNDLYNAQINGIKEGLKNWAVDNNKLLPIKENESIVLTLGQLKIGGYIESKLINPKNNKCFGNDMLLTITRYQKNYIYEVNEDTGVETDKCSDYIKPYMILKGDSITYVELNGTYEEKGVIATSGSGEDITSSVTTKITGSENLIDTSKLGNKYTIEYTVTSDDTTVSMNRTVIIRDTEKPVLNVPDNITLNIIDKTFDPLEGVTVTDNSGENISVKVKSNISLGIPGEYTITYTAIDSSGNSISKTRVVTINKDILISLNNCIKDITTKCENGTKVKVRVNNKENYDFYVINDTGEYIELIMDRNLGEKVAWISKEDYIKAGGTESDYGEYGNNNKGPLTALNQLEDLTKNWTNIPAYDYTLEDDKPLKIEEQQGKSSKTMYQKVTRTNVRARLLSITDIEDFIVLDLKNNSITMPKYLYENLSEANTEGKPHEYWLSTAFSNHTYYSFNVNYNGGVGGTDGHNYGHGGVRPVIKVSKNL